MSDTTEVNGPVEEVSTLEVPAIVVLDDGTVKEEPIAEVSTLEVPIEPTSVVEEEVPGQEPEVIPPPSVRDIVTNWATNLKANAPARQHRDFGEYMLEHLDELIEQLEVA